MKNASKRVSRFVSEGGEVDMKETRQAEHLKHTFLLSEDGTKNNSLRIRALVCNRWSAKETCVSSNRI